MILIAPDKFKGTFSARQICDLVERRLKAYCKATSRPVPGLCCRPLSDGGEGVASVLMPHATEISRGVYDDGMKRLVVSSELIGFDSFADTAVPLMWRSSIALGRAVEPGVPTDIAVGGTATADGGAGFLQGLGARFYDRSGRLIPEPLCPVNLCDVASADLSNLASYRLSGIVDVRASLTEGHLSSLDFAAQKSLPGESLAGLKEALEHFRSVLGGASEWDGAGGGVGYALASVCHAPCRSGACAAVEAIDVDWAEIELVITGEGKVDRQTAFGGKLVDKVCREAVGRGIPVLVLYGAIEPGVSYPNMAQLEAQWEPVVLDLLSKAS